MSAVLSARLSGVLSCLSRCEGLIDVGTDHGHLPIAAVLEGVARSAIAADLREAPLAGARRNILAAGVADRVTPLLSDGLAGLHAESPKVDALTMAGMSGNTMARICERSPEVVAKLSQIVAQPNSGADAFRRWARTHNWHLTREILVVENGRTFQICAFVPGEGEDPAYVVPVPDSTFVPEELYQVGPLLLRGQEATTAKWYAAQTSRLSALIARTDSLEAGRSSSPAAMLLIEEHALWQRALQVSRAVQTP